MAEAPGSALPSGYDEEFVNVVEEDFQCLICQLALKEPVLTRCGHRFCKECLEEHIKRQKDNSQPVTCPADREGIDRGQDVFPDKATERKILSFAIKCPSEDCDWTGELRYKEVHLKTCLYKSVPCTNENCQASVPWIVLNRHVTTSCEWRNIKCEHCSEPHPHCQMQDHVEQCSKFPVTCPNNCGGTVLRELILHHTKDDCPLTLISCPYAQIGCETEVQRKEVEAHIQSAISLHLNLACTKFNDTDEATKQLVVLMGKFQPLLTQLSANLNNTATKLNNTEAKLKDTEIKLNNTETKLKDAEIKLKNTEIKLIVTEGTLKDTQKKLETTTKLVEKLDTRTFIWDIKGFGEILRQAKSGEKRYIESHPFNTKTRTESYGYKLKIKVYLNGDKWGEKTHLSVYIIVMKGEYDAILPWPFKKKIEFTLIDQQEHPIERENVTMKIIPCNIQKCFARPTQEQNSGYRFWQVISHETLHSRRYLVDDTLFLQVEVGP